MKVQQFGLLCLTVFLASCASSQKATNTTSSAKSSEAKKVSIAEPKKTINLDALAKASDSSNVNAAQVASERAKAQKEQEAKAAAAKIAKEEEASRAETEKRTQQIMADAQAKQQAAEVVAQQQAAELALKQQAQADRLAAEEAKALAKAEAIKAQQEAQAREIAVAAEQARVDAEKQAAAELAAQEAMKREAQAKAQAEATARAEQQKAASAERDRQVAAASQKRSASVGYSLPSFVGAKLDSPEFTSVGAERKGNASGSIPAWSDSLRDSPRGHNFKSGDVYVNPYAAERVKFTIRSNNVQQYEDNLSEGVKVLLRKYPNSFYMNVYPTHREGRYSNIVEQRTLWNSTHTKLVNGVDGLENYTGGIPFPFPKNANEVMWNARINHQTPTVNGVLDDMAVYLNGNLQQRRQTYVSEFPFANLSNAVGKTDEDISVNAAFIMVTTDKPDRQKGQMTVIHEALDQAKNERMAWVYIPGSRRVRRAPTVGYDTPDGPGGLITVDDALGFNGAMDRFEWKLLGKKEVYVPYNSYQFDNPKVPYSTLLTKGHVNPEYMRYELHRVWVVEANLKATARHVYVKRRFYIDEDSWHILLTESYDGRGDLWRVAILNTVYDFATKAYVARAQIFHDLQSGGYIAMRLTNETAPMRFMDEPKGEAYYSPANLRSLGK